MSTAEPLKLDEPNTMEGPLSLAIVVADDEPKVLQLLSRSLRLLHHRVVGAGCDGREAVALAAQCKPDLIILDIEMPGMNGIEAARAILRTQTLPIIISTGNADDPTLQRLGDLDIGSYLVKPFSPAQLQAAIFVAMRRPQPPALPKA